MGANTDRLAARWETVFGTCVPHKRELILEGFHHGTRRLVGVELRFDRLSQPSGSRLQDVRESAKKERPVCAVDRSVQANRMVEPDQVIYVAILKPVAYAVTDSRTIRR